MLYRTDDPIPPFQGYFLFEMILGVILAVVQIGHLVGLSAVSPSFDINIRSHVAAKLEDSIHPLLIRSAPPLLTLFPG